MNKKYNVVDIFCGAGGFSLGFSQNRGFNILLGIDCNEDSLETFKNNHNAPVIPTKIEEYNQDLKNNLQRDLKENITNVDVVIAGLPCLPYTQHAKRSRENHEQGKLYIELVEFIKELQPPIFLIENVPQFLHVNGSESNEYNYLKENLSSKYNINYRELDMADYGVPQSRERVIIYGTANNHDIFKFPDKLIKSREEYKTVKDAIGSLPLPCTYNTVPNHYSVRCEHDTLENISKVPEGGNILDLSVRILQKMNKKRKLESLDEILEFKPHSDNYRRLSFNEPSSTMTSAVYGNHISHPTCNRVLTIRECAAIQTFPNDYEFLTKDHSISRKSIESMYDQVINAVPPLFSEILAAATLDFLNIINTPPKPFQTIINLDDIK